MTINRTPLLIALGMLASWCSLNGAHAQDAKINFDDNVKTVLRQRCASCHGPDSKKGDLDITNFTNLMQGGSSGSVIEPGDPDGSYLYNLVTHEDEPVMPPGGKIPDAEIEMIRKWIELGALENQGSKAVMTKKPAAVAMGENPLVRPEFVATFPRVPMEPIQHTPRNPVATSMATSPWSPMIAVGGKNQVVLYDTRTFEIAGVLPFPEGSVNVVRFSRSGSVLLAAGGRAGSSGLAVLWDVVSGERIATIGDELDAVLAADISSDHSMVALGGPGRVVNVYATETGELMYSLKKHTEWITSLAFSTDGVLLATGDRNGGLHVWESWTGRAYLTLNGHSASINAIAWRADSNLVASASKDTTIKLWELNNGSQVKSWGAHAGGANAVTFTRDGQVLSTGNDKIAKLWGQDGGQKIAFAAFSDLGTSVAWCDETNHAIAGDYTGEIRVWQPEATAHVGTFTANPPHLANRLSQAQAHLSQVTAQIAPLNQKSLAATTAAKAVQSQLDETLAVKTQAATTLNEVQSTMAANNEQASQFKEKLTLAQNKLNQYNAAKPLLDQAFQNLSEASAKLPDDEALKQSAMQTQQQVTKLATKITETQNLVTQLQASVTEVTSQVAAINQKIQSSTQTLKTSETKAAELTAQLAPLVESQTVATAALTQAQQQLSAAQAAVTKWQSEIDFIKQLDALAASLAEAKSVVTQRQQELNAAEQELAAAQKKSADIQATVKTATASVQEIESAIQATRQAPK